MTANGYWVFLPGRVMKMFWGWLHDPVNRLTPTELHTLRECILWYVNYISASESSIGHLNPHSHNLG